MDDTHIESATISITSGFVSGEDVLSFVDAGSITGSYNAGSGVLTLTGSASKANYENALESIKYKNTNTDNPNTGNRTVTWLVNDGDANSAAVISTITVAGANDAPTLADANGTLAFTEGDAATVIDGSLTLADVDDTLIESATISITGGFVSGEDVLSFVEAGSITGSYNAGSGVLTLTGSASKANYKTALESIKYHNTNTDNPNTGNRTVTWLVNDGDANSAAVISTITVTAVNDAPSACRCGRYAFLHRRRCSQGHRWLLNSRRCG